MSLHTYQIEKFNSSMFITVPSYSPPVNTQYGIMIDKNNTLYL